MRRSAAGLPWSAQSSRFRGFLEVKATTPRSCSTRGVGQTALGWPPGLPHPQRTTTIAISTSTGVVTSVISWGGFSSERGGISPTPSHHLRLRRLVSMFEHLLFYLHRGHALCDLLTWKPRCRG